MNNTKECIVLVGNIGTGKSTWVNKSLSEIDHKEDYLVFSDDALYWMFSNRNEYL